MRLLRAELRGKPLGIEKRRQPRHDRSLAPCFLHSAEACVAGGQQRVRDELVHATGIARQRLVEGLDRVAILRQKILCYPKRPRGREVRGIQV